MKIVIDIPEDVYTAACVEVGREVHPNQDYRWVRILHGIADGTPLPKGHGRLIDADTLWKSLNEHRYSDDFCIEHDIDYSINLAMTRIVIGDAPTIIEEDKERVMKEYDNYFFVMQHLERNDTESFVWKSVNSGNLAEVMEEAEKQGFVCKLRCYDEMVDITKIGKIKMHRRDMWFIHKADKEGEEYAYNS